ncbi:MAG: phosphatase PAP2 family protein [Deltaproteobacteria bacterium]|jgi:hypothetical protein|nr:phosphatase PAP2 family protein [Deltaproteobacteria bacterium]
MTRTDKSVTRVLAAICLMGFLGANELNARPRYYDDELQLAVPLYALWLSCDNGRDCQGLAELALSLGLTQASTLVIKHSVNEKRPDFARTGDRQSFPSGHAAITLAGAMFVHRKHGFRDALIPYGLALWTSFARVEQNRHRWSDILGAAALSGIIIRAVVKPRDGGAPGANARNAQKSPRFMPSFGMTKDGFALTLTIGF